MFYANLFVNYTSSTPPKNYYTFNGMEFQQDNNLNTFDFHARMYDPQIGRTFQPDPLADQFLDLSPYTGYSFDASTGAYQLNGRNVSWDAVKNYIENSPNWHYERNDIDKTHVDISIVVDLEQFENGYELADAFGADVECWRSNLGRIRNCIASTSAK